MSRATFQALAFVLALPSTATAAWSQASPSAFTHAARYDLMRREVGTIAPDPDGAWPFSYFATRKTYNPAGHLVKVENGVLDNWPSETIAPANWSGFTIFKQVDRAYDAMGRKVREAVSGGGTTVEVTEYGYDLAGRLKCTAARMNPDAWATALADKCVPGPAHAIHGPDRVTRNSYNALGELLKIEKAVGTGSQQTYAAYTYSPNGKRTSVTDANANRSEMTWDGLDRQKRWIFPSKTEPGSVNAADYEEYGYDANANRTSLRKRDGVTLVYTFDALNRMSQKTVPASVTGAPGYSVHYGYDNRGLQIYARFGSAAGPGVANVFDGFGQLATATTNVDGTARTLTMQYDANGNRTAFVPTASTWSYLQGFVYDGLDRLTALQEFGATTVALSYDVAGRRYMTQTGSPNVPSSATGYGYDSVGRLASISHDLAGTAADQNLGFTYNPRSQIRSRTASNDSYASSTAYNAVRNYAVNGLNQYTAAGPASFLYDANGNLIYDGSSNFVYDAENRLVSASGAKTASLAYDPLGRLWQTSGGAAGTTRFVYDSDRLALEYDSAGAVLRSYVHGPGADEPISWYEVPGGWTRRFLKADHQGSIIAVADTNGNAVAINGFDAWGIPNAGNVGRFGYTGQAWIPELGLWYYKARIYSPTLGRFLQVDPIGYDDQINLYAYVGNDPANKVDPTGLYEINCGKSKSCHAAAEKFETARTANLGSKDADIAASARAYGNPGEANGVTVRFLNDKQMDKEYDETTKGHVAPPTLTGNKFTLQVTIRSSLDGKDLKGAVAHEGTHVGQVAALASSYNPTTGNYSTALNLTIFQAETRGFEVGNRISKDFSSNAAIEAHVRKHYEKRLENHIITPGRTE